MFMISLDILSKYFIISAADSEISFEGPKISKHKKV